MPTPIDKQDVVRMNRATIHSAAVFDLDAALHTPTLPDAGQRCMSMRQRTCSREQMGTRSFTALVRTSVNANDPAVFQVTHGVQDAHAIQQAMTGTFEIPDWDSAMQSLRKEGSGGCDRWLITTAAGWGGNPRADAVYVTVYDKDGLKPNTDGSVTIQFGGDPAGSPNVLAIQPGWNYVIRLYRPQQAILDGTWTVPDLQPLGASP